VILNTDHAGYTKMLDLIREVGEGAEQLEPRTLSDYFNPGQVVARHDARAREVLTELAGAEFADEYLAHPLPRPPLEVRLTRNTYPASAPSGSSSPPP
jgi:hypothetical protein